MAEANTPTYTPADEKALALSYAYTALVRALCLSGHLQLEKLQQQLHGAHQRMQNLGEDGAAELLANLAESLVGCDK